MRESFENPICLKPADCGDESTFGKSKEKYQNHYL